MSSKIEWTENTWNPVVGCSIVSKGCDNCYAMRMAHRLEHMGLDKYKGLTRKTDSGRIIWTGKISVDEKALMEPLNRKKPTMYFVDSMGDLFHENVPFEVVDKVFAVMALTPQHTYQVLTKRPERMAEYFSAGSTPLLKRWTDVAELELKQPMSKCLWLWTQGSVPLSNVWLGTSVEDQKTADERIPHLLRCPARVRFLSCEPLLGRISFRWALWVDYNVKKQITLRDGTTGMGHEEFDGFRGIHWVIAGGESGHKARPMHPDWVRRLRDQCQAAGVPFFFKQWGDWVPTKFGGQGSQEFNWSEGKNGREVLPWQYMCKVGKKAAGRLLDGREWNEMPV